MLCGSACLREIGIRRLTSLETCEKAGAIKDRQRIREHGTEGVVASGRMVRIRDEVLCHAADPGIKLRIAVDARALHFGRTYCGNASTHRER
jgi:hypothetical protein